MTSLNGKLYKVLSLCVIVSFMSVTPLLASPEQLVKTFTVSNGLPSNNVSAIAEDGNGLIWIGTWNGLSFYDGNRFYTFRSSKQNGKLITNRIIKLYPDACGNVWFTTYDRRLNLLHTPTGRFVSLGQYCQDHADLSGFLARDFFSNGKIIYVAGFETSASKAAIIKIPDKGTDYKIHIVNIGGIISGAKTLRKVEFTSDGRQWLLTDNGLVSDNGDVKVKGFFEDLCTVGNSVYAISPSGRFIMAQGKSSYKLRGLPSSRVNEMKYSPSVGIVCATDKGVAVYDIKRMRWLDVPMSCGVSHVYVDSMNRIWMTTDRHQVAYYRMYGSVVFPPVRGTDTAASAFITPMLYEDSFGTVWTAAAKGRLAYYDEVSGQLVPSQILSPALRYTNIPEVKKYFPDKNGNLWLISAHGLSLMNFYSRNSKSIPLSPNDETRSIAVLRDGSIMAGSALGYLAHYDSEGNLIGYLSATVDAQGRGSVSVSRSHCRFSTHIYSIYEAPGGDIWIGTKGSGLFQFTPPGRLRQYSPKCAGEGRFPADAVYCIDSDTKGNLLVGTYGNGLFAGKEDADGVFTFRNISEANAAYPKEKAFRQIRRISHNDKGEVVVSTNGGIVAYSCSNGSLSGLKFRVNRLLPGDTNRVYNNNVMQVLLPKNASHAYAIIMGGAVQEFDGNSLMGGNLNFHTVGSLEFSFPHGSILSAVEGKDRYCYFVRETDIIRYNHTDGGVTIIGKRSLGGEYEFTEALPAVGHDGSLYFGAVGGIVRVNPSEVSTLQHVPTLVFTRMRLGDDESSLILNPKSIELPSGNRNLSLSFAAIDYAGADRIEYAYRFGNDAAWRELGHSNTLQIASLTPGVHRLYVRSTNADGTWVDNEKYVDIVVQPKFMETVWAKLLILLLIVLILCVVVHYYNVYRRSLMIAGQRKREHDFYVNVSHKLRTPLSLIGSPVYEVMKTESLSETGRAHLDKVRRNAKNMLELLNEMLSKDFRQEEITDAEPGNATGMPDGTYMSPEAWLEAKEDVEDDSLSETTILVVEDNEDLLEFLRDILSTQYHVITAGNGQEGLVQAEQAQPDFILTDINMPVMDGITMIRHIKERKQLSHIPIIVLSARITVEDRIQGLDAGIDDYITKPFSAAYLRKRIASIIMQRRVIQQMCLERFTNQIGNGSETAEAVEGRNMPVGGGVGETSGTGVAQAQNEYRLMHPQIIEEDQVMMESLIKFLDEHISDENLRVEDMAEAVGVGRTVFFGKIKAIVGMSPRDFLRTLRMQRAQELIAKSKMNFSQVAFNVGFSDPKYFARCFKKETGMSPSEYRNKMENDSVKDVEEAT